MESLDQHGGAQFGCLFIAASKVLVVVVGLEAHPAPLAVHFAHHPQLLGLLLFLPTLAVD